MEARPLHRKPPNLYVAIYQDGVQVHRTRTIERELAPKWNDISVLSSDSPSSVITLRLYRDTWVGLKRHTFLAELDIEMSALLKLCNSDGEGKVVNLELSGVDGTSKGKPAGTLSVRLSTITPVQAGPIAIDHIQRDIANVGLGPATSEAIKILDKVAGVEAKQSGLVSVLGAVIFKLHVIVRIGDEIAKIHPYANVAWKVLTSVYQAVKTQQETDDKLLKLVTTMVDVYSFVDDVEFLAQKIKRLEDTVMATVKQTVECALFIQEYTGSGFCD
ncbi:hypothetical protein B0H10DRAFT_1081013 [Mycena sp. CBHHK59/15]|nr:hypothetical protein B0H10DRAFT_1081013 [Mycena sp. CBHHK59/15]